MEVYVVVAMYRCSSASSNSRRHCAVQYVDKHQLVALSAVAFHTSPALRGSVSTAVIQSIVDSFSFQIGLEWQRNMFSRHMLLHNCCVGKICLFALIF